MNIPAELRELLRARNGFAVLEGSLLVRSLDGAGPARSVFDWNNPETWQTYYGSAAPPGTCFACDAFGVQFVLSDRGVHTFDLESAEIKWIARNLQDWAIWLFADLDRATGYPAWRDWNAMHAPLKLSQRLMARKPFVLGGDCRPGNLVAMDEFHQLRVLGPIAQQIKDLPDGTEITIKVAN